MSKGNPIELNMKLNKKNNSDPRGRIEETEEKVTQGHPNNEMDTERDKMTGEVDIPMDEEGAAVEEPGVTMEEPHPGEELKVLRQKHDELNDSYLRLHAEYDNFRKRTLKEKAELIKSGGERVLLETIALWMILNAHWTHSIKPMIKMHCSRAWILYTRNSLHS